jgi:hypothetical protein
MQTGRAKPSLLTWRLSMARRVMLARALDSTLRAIHDMLPSRRLKQSA